LATGENYARALELTQSALKLKTANYTVWQYCRDTLKAQNADLYEKLVYVEEVIEDIVE
jgi:protein farnesyltransferase/geranylgeranyltransferase type-1 subunit alpha